MIILQMVYLILQVDILVAQQPGASAYVGWDERATQGATLGVNAVAAGSTRFGSTQASILNGYYGPTTFAGVPWVAADAQPPENYLNDGYYVAQASSGDIVDITLKVTDIDFSRLLVTQTTTQTMVSVFGIKQLDL